MFDPEVISSRLLKSLEKQHHHQQWSGLVVPLHIRQNPVSLSYWCCDNLPFDSRTRQMLMDCPTYYFRIQMLLNMLEYSESGTNSNTVSSAGRNYNKNSNEGMGSLNCVHCDHTVAMPFDPFSLSDTNIIGTFVNPSGHVMQVGTYLNIFADNAVSCVGESVIEHSWFSGYGWSMCVCSTCGSHLGWRFDAVKPNLTPSRFYGFRQECLVRGVTRRRATATADMMLGVRSRQEYEEKEEGGGNEEEDGQEEVHGNSYSRSILSHDLLRSWWMAARARLLRSSSSGNHDDGSPSPIEEENNTSSDEDVIDGVDDVDD
jgi:hypothetical protein